MTHAYKSISDKIQRHHEKRWGRKRIKQFPRFPSKEVVQAEVGKKPDVRGHRRGKAKTM